jgi:hypothetical protein
MDELRLSGSHVHIDYTAVRAAISMQQVLRLLGYQPVSRRGQQWRGPCPIHDPAAAGQRRCFSVHLGRHVFRCFRCGAQGNQLDLWQLVHRLPLHASALHLCYHAQIPPPTHPSAIDRPPTIRNSHRSLRWTPIVGQKLGLIKVGLNGPRDPHQVSRGRWATIMDRVQVDVA